MKILNLCIALMFSLSLCLAAAPGESFAKSSATTSTETAQKSATSSKKSAAKTATKAVNVNSADKKALTQLPGVGPATADAIVKYRKANGKFKSANDLMNVKGIGEKTLKKMKPFLKF